MIVHTKEEAMKSSLYSFTACIVFCASVLTVPLAHATADGGRLSSGELPPPRIIAPAEIAELRGVDHVTFTWQGVQGAAGYHLVLARDRRFKHIVAENIHVNSTSYTVGNLNYGTYFLEISSVSAGGEGPFSQRLSFIVVPPPPAGVSPQELQGKGQLP
jgi:hypothetical protein